MFGTRRGALCTTVELKEAQLFEVPHGFSLAEAACTPIGHSTAFNALVQQGRVCAGETILVLGATGGTGFAAVQFAKALGLTVIALGSSDTKLDAVKHKGGADVTINTSQQPHLSSAVRNATANKSGVDIIFDCVGGDQLDKRYLRGGSWHTS